jgi:hypothetical protein
MSVQLTLELHQGSAKRTESVVVSDLIIAGWTGRDPVAVEKHIRELEELGVARPPSTPCYYRVAAARLTNGDQIEVIGDKSSGEVEFVLLQHAGHTFVGVGSDHTDRVVEAYDVTVSKQMCEKPLGNQFWDLEDVKGHWDRLILRSRSHEPAGGWRLYQEGSVSEMKLPSELVSNYSSSGLTNGTMMFCGTLAAQGGVRAGSAFSFELEDPVRGARITHQYDVLKMR